MGAAAWTLASAGTSAVPFGAIARARARLDLAGIGAGRLVTGILLYGALLFGHPFLIGVSPLP
jgi:uncharacterized membrane protein